MKRFAVTSAILLIAWYALVPLACPCLTHCTRPLLVSSTLAHLKGHLQMVANHLERFGETVPSGMLDRLQRMSIRGNQYRIIRLAGTDDAMAAVIAYPKRHRAYVHGPFDPATFFCWEENTFPTYGLLPDGRLLEDYSTGYRDGHVPNSSSLQTMREGIGWPELLKPPSPTHAP